MKSLIFSLISLFLITACSPLNPPNADQFQAGELRDNIENENENRFIEGEMTDITDLNPNFLDLNNETENERNHGAYQEKLKREVDASDQFSFRSVINNGRYMHVNVNANGKYTKDDVKELENQLQLAVPRYEIKLNVNNNQ